MLIYDAVITGSFSYDGVDISSVTSSGESLNSLNQFTSSYNTGSFTGSFKGNGSGLLGVVSASFATNALTASYAANVPLTASFAISASQAQDAISASLASNADLLDGKDSTEFAITGSNSFIGTQYITDTTNPTGFGTSAAVYTDGGLRVTKDAYVSGTIYVNNLSVFGTQSINYITSSQLNISTNIISVNTDTPFIRFGGLSVYDSGSTGLTGSMLWDSERDHWIYSNPSGSTYNSGMLISGPRNSGSLGNEQGTINNVIVKGQGGDHVTSSQIIDDGTTVRIPGNLQVTGSTIVTSNLRTDTGLGIKYGSFTSTSGYLNLFSALAISTYTLNLKNGTSGFETALSFNNTANRNYTFPNADGTIALTDNLSSYLPLSGGTLTGPLSGTSATFSGTLGIGTATSPAAELQVGKASDVTIALSNSSSVTSGNRGSIAWYNSSVSTVANIKATAVTDNVGTQLEFYTRPAAGSLTQVMTLASTGAATFSSSVTAGSGADGNGYLMKATDGSVHRIIDPTATGGASSVNIGAIGTSTGNVRIHATDVLFLSNGGSAERMRITATGTVQPGANGTQDLGTSSLRWATVYTSDLDMSNGIGDYTIVEGEEDLFLYNNKTNKVFKFVIQEVDPSEATPKMKK